MGYQHLGLLSIISVWATLLFLIIRWRGTNALTISRHASSAKTAYIIFATAISFSVALYHIFLINWFIPHYQLDSSFTALVSISNIFLFLTLIIPDADSIFRTLHRIVAYSFAISLIWVASYLSIWIDLHPFTKAVGIGAVCVMIAIWILFFFIKASRRHILIYQLLYILSFQLLVISATYL